MDRKTTALFEYFKRCPLLSKLWSIAANEEIGVAVVLPQGTSPAVMYNEGLDVNGDYFCEIVPYPSLYEDFQINCYYLYDAGDSSAPENNVNVLSYEETEQICEWVNEQNKICNFPEIGENIVSVECNPFKPQIRYVDEVENVIAYYITVRVRYVNRNREKRTVEYELTD